MIRDQAFKSNALAEYSPRVEFHVKRFIGRLGATEGKEVDCVPIIQTLTFDMYDFLQIQKNSVTNPISMSDLSFGRDPNSEDKEEAAKFVVSICTLSARMSTGSI